jgi:hypothetical protein
VFGWVSLLSSSFIIYYKIKVPTEFNGDMHNDVAMFMMAGLLGPSALLAGFLWLAGFVNLHAGETRAAPATPAKDKKHK